MKKYFSGIVLGFVLGTACMIGVAQATTPQTPAPQPVDPKLVLDENEQLLLQLVGTRGQIAQAACDGLQTTQAYTVTRAEFLRRVESKHPGYTFSFGDNKLVPKAPAK